MSEYLNHSGVKGMKWGVRKTPEEIEAERKFYVTKQQYKLKRQAAATAERKERVEQRQNEKERLRREKFVKRAALTGTALAVVGGVKIAEYIAKKKSESKGVQITKKPITAEFVGTRSSGEALTRSLMTRR